ncbi:MAG TPA: MFS transporter [Thermomicrobiales bacterium]|nr:MFS transporter [Thermomicrobiales bacterium]
MATAAPPPPRISVRDAMTNPIARGVLLLAIATFAFGFALNAQQNIVSNFFENTLGLNGPQFGYITAIREVPGFLLIFVTALFYRLSLPHLTALALGVLATGYMLFGTADSFWTVAPWVVLSSAGYHTFLQTQYALGMSLVSENRSGAILGRMAAVNQAGAVVAMGIVFLVFQFDVLDFAAMFVVCGIAALVAAIAIIRFPHVQDGEIRAQQTQREPIVIRREYRRYYLLSTLDGARQQIFFSFGLWVLVDHFRLGVPAISLILLAVALVSMVTSQYIGRTLDLVGERRMLKYVNIAYIVALLAYGLIDNVGVAIVGYVLYSLIMPLSSMGASTYLRKIAPAEDIAPSLAMGITMQHAAAIVVPVAAGAILNYAGYQIPFLIAVVFAALTIPVTQRLDPANQKSARRLAQDAARASGRSTDTTVGPAVPVADPLPGTTARTASPAPSGGSK